MSSFDSKGRLTRFDAEKAVYIDFEGPAPKVETPDRQEPPVLLGILVEEEWEQVVVDPSFFGIADYCSDSDVPCRAELLCDVQLRVVERCLNEGRALVGFGTKELHAFLLFGDPALREQTVAVYVDGETCLRSAAKRPLRIRHSLSFYRQRAGLPPLPKHLEGKKTGPRIGDVRRVVTCPSNEGSFGRARSAKGKWTKVRDRNRYDCFDLQAALRICCS